MNLALASLLFILLTSLCAVPSRNAASARLFTSDQPKSSNSQRTGAVQKYQATVSKEEAIFTFPIPPHRRYEVSDRGLLGIHVIKVRNINQDYEFGFYLDNPLDGALGMVEGNLNDLLNAPMGFFKAFRVSNGSAQDLNEVKVEGFADNNLDKLTIRVSGKKSVEALFSGRSKYCTFESRILDGAVRKTSVRVVVAYRP